MVEKSPDKPRGRYGDGTVYQQADGRWRSEVLTGEMKNGRPVRKILYGKTKSEANAKRRAAVAALARGELVGGKMPTLEAWLETWLSITPESRIRPRTRVGYRSLFRTWIHGQPIARKRLDKVTPTDLSLLYKRLRDAKRSETTVLQLHRVLSRGLKVAVQHRIIAVNPASRIDAPTPAAFSPTVFTLADARGLIQAASELPPQEGARWMVALALGPRQGERLGLAEDDFDPAAGTLRIQRTLYLMSWKHGCAPEGSDPVCGKKNGWCPKRHGGGIHTGPPKSEAGTRTIKVPAPVATALKDLLAFNAQVRSEEGKNHQPWTAPSGETIRLLFCRRNGKPIPSSEDYAAWQKFLASAGVPRARVHDARHTSATVLLAMGVDPRVVMDILGWSSITMLHRYQHVLDELKTDAAEKVTEALFQASPPGSPEPEGNVIPVDFKRRQAR
ncbi:tyrosine-type recombinase/integrase [Arthrobacter sp. NPDC090010]|uniref:tyrosine-type recombinase/integrase n=1 Tax=Arthrobacter sp. NPDC090010 TaxID=3363942 RepID=UPI0038063835